MLSSGDEEGGEVQSTNPDALASIKRMEEIHAGRAARGELEATLPPATQQRAAQLPIWPEPVRGAPNTLLRSAFFAGIHSKKRRELGSRISPDRPKQGVTIAAQEGSRITYAGDQLNQYDADVFFEALHRARGNPLPTECIFTGYDFLKLEVRKHLRSQRRLTKVKRRSWERKIQNKRRTYPLH